MLLKHGENTTSRIAGFETVDERVREKIFLCAFFVRFHCIVENWLKLGRCGSRMSLRHKGEVMIDRGIIGSWIMGKEKCETPQERAGTAYL